MASAFEAAGHHHAVHAALEGGQDVIHLDLSGARKSEDTDVVRVLESQNAGKIGHLNISPDLMQSLMEYQER